VHPPPPPAAVKDQKRPLGGLEAHMTVELFRDFWWLIFPMFGMVMAIIGMSRDSAYDRRVIRQARQRLERE
jgi:hypothetical protein